MRARGSDADPSTRSEERETERRSRVGSELRRAYSDILAEPPPDAMLDLIRRLEQSPS